MSECSGDLVQIQRDDVLLDLVGGWFRYARDAHDSLVSLLRTSNGFYQPAGSSDALIHIIVDKFAWSRLVQLAGRDGPSLDDAAAAAYDYCDCASPVGVPCALPSEHGGWSHRDFSGVEWNK